MIRNILVFIAILLLIAFQVGFLNTISEGIVHLNIIVLFLIFLVFNFEIIPLMWWSLITGMIGELFSPYPFGITTLLTLITVSGLKFLFDNFLTNRSLYTFIILTAAGSAVYNILLLASSFLLYSFNIFEFHLLAGSGFLNGVFWQIIFNSITSFVIFLIFGFLTRRVHKRFLVTK